MASELSFGSWIKRQRKTLDLTQAELAQRISCSLSAISKIEGDERRPSRLMAELLALHLEIPPDQRALFLKAARQDKATTSLDRAPLAQPAPAPESIPRRSNLPGSPTLFVGRDHELDVVRRLLQDPACRLLTLTGPGGVGKTRLALEAARKLEASYPDGIFFLSLAAVNLPESIVPVLAANLGIVFSGPAEPILQVSNALRHKELLLIFDNMEHLVAGGAVLGEILQNAPGVKLLLTSREQMQLRWEWVFEVQGLPVPEEASQEALESSSAATLFIQRARQASQNFHLKPEQAPALVRICKYVDGLPLAIELAAGWVRIMSFDEIAQELEQNLDLLETSMQDVPARQRSIKVVFDHSWALLSEEERAVMMKLAVFSGGFTGKAADVVAGASLFMLASLLSKSLLRFNARTERYDMHELIRQYCTAQLQVQPAEEQQVREKYSQYFTRWIARLEAPLKSAPQEQTSALIRTETANWISAWRWNVRKHHYDRLQQMAPCLYWYYEIHGYYAEAIATYQFTVDELRAAGAPDNLTEAQEKTSFTYLVNQLGWFKFRIGEIAQAEALFGESHALAANCTDQVVVYHILINWGYLALVKGDIAAAKRWTLESLASAQKLGNAWHIAIAETILGSIEAQQGNLAEAYQQLVESLKVWRQVGDPRGLIFCMLYLSSAALALGKTETAEAVLLESNAIAQGKLDRWAQAFGLDLRGQVAMAQGQYEQAAQRFRESRSFSQEIGDHWAATGALIHEGEAQAAQGNTAQARDLFREAYASARQGKWAPTILEALLALASVEEEIAVGTRLAVTLTVLAHAAVTPQLRQRTEGLREHLEARLTEEQVRMAQEMARGKNAELWEF